MRKTAIVFLVLALLLVQAVAVSAITASEAKSEWLDLKEERMDLDAVHKQAKLDYAADKTPENAQAVVDTGKDLLNKVLDEAEAWLTWKEIEAEEDDRVPQYMKDTIAEDVLTNKDKIDVLRNDVDGVTNQLELGVVALKMIGKYLELLTDVARDSGLMWVHIGNTQADRIADYEAQLRETADTVGDSAAIDQLDLALDELEIAKRNIENAEDTYDLVRIPGTPLIKFSEGNNYLRAARDNLLAANMHLGQAYNSLVR
jgi:hypothetical protein